MTKSSRKCWKLRNKIPKWRWKFIFLHEKTMFLFKYGYRSKYTEYGTIFQKNHILPSNFFSSSNMFFIRLFLGKTWKKIGCHRACFLINCRERWTWFWYVCMHVCMYACMYAWRVVILAQTLFLLCSWRAVELPHRLHSRCPKLQRGHLILQLDGREVEIHSRLPDDAHFFVFLVFWDQTRKLSADFRHSYYE